jgi:hypothetical protein
MRVGTMIKRFAGAAYLAVGSLCLSLSVLLPSFETMGSTTPVGLSEAKYVIGGACVSGKVQMQSLCPKSAANTCPWVAPCVNFLCAYTCATSLPGKASSTTSFVTTSTVNCPGVVAEDCMYGLGACYCGTPGLNINCGTYTEAVASTSGNCGGG